MIVIFYCAYCLRYYCLFCVRFHQPKVVVFVCHVWKIEECVFSNFVVVNLLQVVKCYSNTAITIANPQHFVINEIEDNHWTFNWTSFGARILAKQGFEICKTCNDSLWSVDGQSSRQTDKLMITSVCIALTGVVPLVTGRPEAWRTDTRLTQTLRRSCICWCAKV